MREKDIDTIIAPISATIGGSVSLIRVSGTDSISTTTKFFKSIKLNTQPGNKFFHGHFFDLEHNSIDDVIILLYKKPNSYTGEDVIEISCHGNPFIVEQIISQYLKMGCRMAEPGEFTKRAFLNGKMDLLQAEAVADIIAAKSLTSIKNSLMQIQGRASYLVRALKEQLINVASLITVDLDFSEEDLNIITHDQLANRIKQSLQTVNKLLNSYNFGRRVNKGVEVIICGKPNVGKSSLMNSLIKQDRVIVSHIPGTTRDTIHEDVVIDNTLIRFVDTAGIRISNNKIEIEGINRSEATFRTADIILLVVDISDSLEQEDLKLMHRLLKSSKEKLIITGNKNDKQINLKTEEEIKRNDVPVVLVSAKTNKGVNKLEREIVKQLKINNDYLSEEIIITNQRQYDLLKKTKNALANSLKGTKKKLGFEFIAIDMQNAIEWLSEITGEITTDDILNNVFSKFCIGK